MVVMASDGPGDEARKAAVELGEAGVR